MKKIFISYKRADKDIVMPIVDRINSELGEICWIDLDGIETNSIFETKIVKAIEDSKIFLFMFSQRHKGIAIEDEFDDDLNLVRHQDWTIRELNLADNKYKTLVNLDNSSLDICPLIRGRFQSANYTNATDPRQMDNLIDKIGKLLKIGRNTQHQDKSSKHVLTPSNDEQSGSPRDAKESDENNMEAFETGKNTDKQDVVEKDDASYNTVHEYTKLLRDLRKWVEKNNPSESSHADNGNNGNRPETTETEKAIEENDEKIKEYAPYISVKGKCGVKDLPDCSQLNCRLHNLELHVGDKLYVQDEGTSTTASIVGFNMRDKITRSYRPDRNGKVYVIIDVPIKQLTGKVKVTLQDTTPKNQVKTSTQGEPTVDESPLTREVVCSVCGKKEEITDFNMVEGVLFALHPIMGTLAYAGKKGYEKLKGGYICPECEAKKKKESMLDFKKFFNK